MLIFVICFCCGLFAYIECFLWHVVSCVKEWILFGGVASCCLIRSQCVLLTAFVPLQSWLRQMLLIAVIGVKTVGMKALCRIVVIGVKTVGMKVKPVQGDLDKCTGFTGGSATFCMRSPSSLTTPDDIGKMAGDSDNSSCEHTEYVMLRCCVALP